MCLRDTGSRIASAHAPLDESLARAVVDLSGRASLVLNADHAREQIGDLDPTCSASSGGRERRQDDVHIDLLRGVNAHHQAESMFKAFALALGAAVAPDPRAGGKVPSTRGMI